MTRIWAVHEFLRAGCTEASARDDARSATRLQSEPEQTVRLSSITFEINSLTSNGIVKGCGDEPRGEIVSPQRKSDQREVESDESRPSVHEEVLAGLERLLHVDRNAIAGALDELARRKRPAGRFDQIAEQYGIRIANQGPHGIRILTTTGETKQLREGQELYVAPKQFGLTKDVPNLPYHAIGVMPNCFLSIRIEAEEDATVLLDWTKLYQNAGLWGTMRLVKRVLGVDEQDIAPLRELKAEVTIGPKRIVEVYGMGLGVDLFGEMSMMKRGLTTLQTREGRFGERMRRDAEDESRTGRDVP